MSILCPGFLSFRRLGAGARAGTTAVLTEGTALTWTAATACLVLQDTGRSLPSCLSMQQLSAQAGWTCLFFQVREGRGRMRFRPVHERRLLPQLREQLRVRVRPELLGDSLPNGRERLLPVRVLEPLAEPLPADVLPRDTPRRWAGDRSGLPDGLTPHPH